MKKSLFTAMLALFFLTHGQMIWAVDKTASVHTRYTFERGWKFIRSDDANFSRSEEHTSELQSHA